MCGLYFSLSFTNCSALFPSETFWSTTKFGSKVANLYFWKEKKISEGKDNLALFSIIQLGTNWFRCNWTEYTNGQGLTWLIGAHLKKMCLCIENPLVQGRGSQPFSNHDPTFRHTQPAIFRCAEESFVLPALRKICSQNPTVRHRGCHGN